MRGHSLREDLAARRVVPRTTLLGSLLVAGGWSCSGEPTGTAAGGVRARWFQAQPGESRARPAVAGGLVYFGTGDGQVIARDVNTGAARWATSVDVNPVDGANVVARAGVVVVATVRHTVALDATTGRELWRYQAPVDSALGSSRVPGQVVLSHLDADDAAVYVPAWGASVSALDLRTGAARWVWQPGRAATDTAAAGRFRSGSSGVRVSGDTVFAAAWHFTVENGVRSEAWLLALDRATGRELWRATLPHARGGTVFGAPCLAGRVAVLAVSSGRVAAVDRATGQPVWAFQSPAAALTPIGQAEADGDAVYADGGDGVIYALDAATGAVRWKGAFPTQTSANLVVSARRVYAPVFGFLYVFDRATGRRVAETMQPNPGANGESLFSSPPTVADGRAFVTVHGGAWSFDEP